MTPEIYREVVAQLARSPQTVAQLHAPIRELGSDWSLAQLRLFLACLAGIEVSGEGLVSLGAKSPRELLVDAMVEVVKSGGGKPIPAARVVQLLPDRFVTTAVQVKALAKACDRLEVFGPGLLQLK